VSPYFPDDMFDTYKRRKVFSFHLAIFEIEATIFENIKFNAKLFLHIVKICQISRACILNLDSWCYNKKHRMENLRHIKLISTYSSFSYHVFLRLLGFQTSHSSTYTVFTPMFTSPYSLLPITRLQKKSSENKEFMIDI
jgi:hypothetical protein